MLQRIRNYRFVKYVNDIELLNSANKINYLIIYFRMIYMMVQQKKLLIV